jgi:hypothetical protein
MTVNMGAEIYAFFLDLAQICKREHLKAAGICKDRLVPVHKLMQSAVFFDQLISCTHMKMVGIRKLYLGTDLTQIISRNSTFNSTYGSNIHKNRCLDGSVYCFHLGAFCPSVFCDHLILHTFMPLRLLKQP